eukprot:365619-Chlamydomonas_euryale.AAC.23
MASVSWGIWGVSRCIICGLVKPAAWTRFCFQAYVPIFTPGGAEPSPRRDAPRCAYLTTPATRHAVPPPDSCTA